MMKYITTKKLVNKSGLNEKIKKLATKEKLKFSNRSRMKSKTRQSSKISNILFKYFFWSRLLCQ